MLGETELEWVTERQVGDWVPEGGKDERKSPGHSKLLALRTEREDP